MQVTSLPAGRRKFSYPISSVSLTAGVTSSVRAAWITRVLIVP